jgi:predicted nucleic acid-binding protein
MADPPLLSEALPLTPRAIDISSAYRIGVYDCIYVALAESENCNFVTADDRVVKNLQSDFPFIIALSTLP